LRSAAPAIAAAGLVVLAVFAWARNAAWLSLVVCCLLAGLFAWAFLQAARQKRRCDFFEGIVQGTTDAIHIRDLEGRWLFANRATERVVGKSSDALLGRRDEEILEPEAAATIATLLGPLVGGDSVRHVEARLDIAGRVRTWSSIFGPIKDAGGRVTGLFGISRDLSERLRGEEERFRAVLEGAPDAIVCVDADGGIVYANAQAEQLFGYRRDELLGQRVEVLLPARFLPGHVENRQRYLTNPEVGPIGVGRELFARRRDGREVPVEITLSPVTTSEGVVVVSVVRDITERRRAQNELHRSLADLESFAYVASHDLQEPLRMVVSYLELISRRHRGQLDAEAGEFIDFAMEGAARMQRLIADLLSFSRVQPERRKVEPIELEDAFSEALFNLRAAIAESGAVITHDPLPRLHADRTQMVRLLQNLLSNAIKFRSESPPAVHVSAAAQDGGWEFAVRDNGIGIAAEHLERIFVIFQRLHSGSRYPGTGIGLATCKKIVEQWGGKIWAVSEPGSGTEIHFNIPTEAES
jgi:PAS domain S-box-containing protein